MWVYVLREDQVLGESSHELDSERKIMRILHRTRTAVAGIALILASAGSAFADLPAAFGRAPADAQFVVSIGDVSAFYQNIQDLIAVLDLPEGEVDLSMVQMVLDSPLLNPAGSIAIVKPAGDDDLFDDHGVIAILPISQAGTDMIAQAVQDQGEGDTIAFDTGQFELFVKDLGGGFAAASPYREVVDAFEAGAGGHAALMGSSCLTVCEQSDLSLYFSQGAMQQLMSQGSDQIAEQAEVAAMMGADMGGQIELVEQSFTMASESILAGAFGLTLGRDGVSLDFATQFEEGSEFANALMMQGNSTGLMNHLPASQYLFAIATDSSANGFKKVFEDLFKDEMDDQFGMHKLMNMEQAQGVAITVGVPAGGIMGGVLTNTTAYFRTDDADQFADAMADGLREVSNNEQFEIDFEYEAGVETVDGASVDAWSIGVPVDDSNPMAMQMQQAMAMMFGPAGKPSGYIARTDQGAVITYSKSKDLLNRAVSAAIEGEGLADDEQMAMVANRLPDNRVFEGYMNVKTILDQVLPFASMMMGPIDVDLPENMAPVGLGASQGEGGIHLRLVVPSDVLFAATQIANHFAGQAEDFEEDEETPEEGSRQPRF